MACASVWARRQREEMEWTDGAAYAEAGPCETSYSAFEIAGS